MNYSCCPCVLIVAVDKESHCPFICLIKLHTLRSSIPIFTLIPCSKQLSLLLRTKWLWALLLFFCCPKRSGSFSLTLLSLQRRLTLFAECSVLLLTLVLFGGLTYSLQRLQGKPLTIKTHNTQLMCTRFLHQLLVNMCFIWKFEASRWVRPYISLLVLQQCFSIYWEN